MPLALSNFHLGKLQKVHSFVTNWRESQHPFAQIPASFIKETLLGTSSTLQPGTFHPQTVTFDGQTMSGYVMPSEDPNFVVNRNLLYAGTYILNLMTLREDVAVGLANEQQMIFVAAHPYNASRQSGLLPRTF